MAFKFVEEKNIRSTCKPSVLPKWVRSIAGNSEAERIRAWAKDAKPGCRYDGEEFFVICVNI